MITHALYKQSDDVRQIIDRMLEREGGTDRVTRDSGGVTRGGIAESRGTHTADQIRNLTDYDIRGIWRKDWDEGGAHFPDRGAGEAFFDIHGNAGKPRATRWLQEAINQVRPSPYEPLPTTGHFGPMTREALTTVDQAALTRALLQRQKEHHNHLTTANPEKYQRYADGWGSRRQQLRSSPLINPLLDPDKRVAPVVPQPDGAVKVKGIPPPGAEILPYRPPQVTPTTAPKVQPVEPNQSTPVNAPKVQRPEVSQVQPQPPTYPR